MQRRLLLVDMIVPETASASFSKLLDLNMVVMNGGRERTKAEFCALLEAAAYKLTRIIPTMAPQSVIESFIAEGPSGTVMPGFGKTLTEDQIVDVFKFARSW